MVRAAADKSSTPSPAGSLQEVFEQCRRLGMRLSRQRRMVLDLLWSEKSHLSARDIFEQLNLRGRSIGHTSVYQNLEALQSAGVIECLDRASGRLYGYRSDPHSHLTCLDSGSIEDIDVVLPDDSVASDRTAHRLSHRVVHPAIERPAHPGELSRSSLP